MKLDIGNKIAQFRRENKKTQEQLADYVGVSVAAVSKWETNQSYPDITLLPSIADFFEVSIDGLLGYTIADNEKKLKEIRDSIFEPMVNDDYNTVLPVIFDALKKYPNDFDLLEAAARMLGDRAWTSETREQDFKDAITYYERAIQCAETNQAKHNTFQLKKNIAQIYDNLGDTAKAIEKMNEINESNALGFEIARLKYKNGEKIEAKEMVQPQLWTKAFDLYRIASELSRYYGDEENTEMMLKLQKFHIRLMEEFVNDTPNYADNLASPSYLACAKAYKKLERYDEMWENLERAVYHAARFDMNPSFKMNSLNFMEGLGEYNMMSTSSSGLICNYILKEIRDNFAEFAEDERYAAFCNELESAKQTKVEAGVWK